MPDPVPENLSRLPGADPWSAERIGKWFRTLGERLIWRTPIRAEAFLVVVLNEDQIRVYCYGTAEQRRELVAAAADYQRQKVSPDWFPSPEEQRAWRQQQQREREALQAAEAERLPYHCEACGKRYQQERYYTQHLNRCRQRTSAHYCLGCGGTEPNFEAWKAHVCPALTVPPAGTPGLHLVGKE